MELTLVILFHKILAFFSALFMVTAAGAAIFFRRKPYWLTIHKSFNLLSVIFLFPGISAAYFVIRKTNGNPLAQFHPVSGILTLGLVCASLILGFYQFRAVDKVKIRTIHRLLGRFAVLSIIITLGSGLIHAGFV